VTRRLSILLAAGAVVIAVASAGALLSLRGATRPSPVSPGWGFFDDAEWRALAAQLPSLDAGSLHLVSAMSKRLVLVADRRGCAALVRDGRASPPICRLRQPVLAFAQRDGRFLDVVGLASPNVTTLVVLTDGQRQGASLLPAGSMSGFGFGGPGPIRLEALAGDGRVIAKLYCASDLRGVCGMSAHRRS
jgi:hypothetical protein